MTDTNAIESNQNIVEQPNTVESIPQEQSPDQLAEERAREVGNQANLAIRDSLKLMNGVNQDIGLSPAKAAQLEQEGRVFDALGAVNNQIQVLAERTQRGIKEARVKNLPIKWQEGFQASTEIEAISKSPIAQKPGRLAEFKERLVYHSRGWAQTYGEAVKQVTANPDISVEELEKTFLHAAQKYGLQESFAKPPTQLGKYRLMAEDYVAQHKAVEELRQKYPNNNDMYKALFGAEPKGDIEIIKGPMTLYFRCHDNRDYVRIYIGGDPEDPNISQEQKPMVDKLVNRAMSTGGASLSANIAGLDWTIIVEKSEGRPFDMVAQSTYEHEVQHAMKRLFRRDEISARRVATFSALKSAEDPSQKAECLKDFLEAVRLEDEEKTKDEIFAYFKGGTPVQQIQDILLKKQAEGGLYDYFYEHTRIKEPPGQNLKQKLSETIDPQVVAATFDKVFSEKDYRYTVKSAVRAFAHLTQAGLSNNEIIALLVDKDLSRWPIERQRSLEQKNERSSVREFNHARSRESRLKAAENYFLDTEQKDDLRFRARVVSVFKAMDLSKLSNDEIFEKLSAKYSEEDIQERRAHLVERFVSKVGAKHEGVVREAFDKVYTRYLAKVESAFPALREMFELYEGSYAEPNEQTRNGARAIAVAALKERPLSFWPKYTESEKERLKDRPKIVIED